MVLFPFFLVVFLSQFNTLVFGVKRTDKVPKSISFPTSKESFFQNFLFSTLRETIWNPWEGFFCNMFHYVCFWFKNSDDHFSSAALETKRVKLHQQLGFFWQKFGFFHCVLTFNSFWYKGYSCYNSTISPISLCGMSKLYLLVEKWCFKRQFKRLFPNSKGCNIDGLDTKHGL